MKKNLVNGEWLDAIAGKDDINPSDITDIVGTYARGDAQQTNLAVEAAVSAQRTWAQSTLQQRFDVLDFVGSEILARMEELGHAMGAPVSQASASLFANAEIEYRYSVWPLPTVWVVGLGGDKVVGKSELHSP